LETGDIVEFIKSLRLRWHGYTARRNKEIMPKQIVTATKEDRLMRLKRI
jgi:hypothetical protein